MKSDLNKIVAGGIFFLFIVIFSTIGTTYFILNSDSIRLQDSQIAAALQKSLQTEQSMIRIWAVADSTHRIVPDSLANALKRVERLLFEKQSAELYRAHTLDETAKRAETTMQVATALITSISFVFGLVVLVVGWLSFKKHDELKLEIEKTLKEKSAIETQLAEIKRDVIEERKKLLDELSAAQKKLLGEMNEATNKLLEDLQIFKARTAKTEKSVYTLVDAFSSTFIDIMAALGKNQIISSGENEALRNRTIEMQYRLSLEHPEVDERQQALYGLSALGTADSIPILRAVIENREENTEIRLLAQQAVHAIEKRETEKKQSKISNQQDNEAENNVPAN